MASGPTFVLDDDDLCPQHPAPTTVARSMQAAPTSDTAGSVVPSTRPPWVPPERSLEDPAAPLDAGALERPHRAHDPLSRQTGPASRLDHFRPADEAALHAIMARAGALLFGEAAPPIPAARKPRRRRPPPPRPTPDALEERRAMAAAQQPPAEERRMPCQRPNPKVAAVRVETPEAPPAEKSRPGVRDEARERMYNPSPRPADAGDAGPHLPPLLHTHPLPKAQEAAMISRLYHQRWQKTDEFYRREEVALQAAVPPLRQRKLPSKAAEQALVNNLLYKPVQEDATLMVKLTHKYAPDRQTSVRRSPQEAEDCVQRLYNADAERKQQHREELLRKYTSG